MLTVEQRKIILNLREDGKKQQQIADIVGCSQVSVSKWISRHKSGRTLKTLPRSGRPTKLKEKFLKNLRKKLLREIKEANKEFGSLDTKQLSEIIEKEVGKKYSLRHVERIMHRLDFSLITPRSEHIRHDPKRVKEFRKEFKKNSNRNMWIMSSSLSTR